MSRARLQALTVLVASLPAAGLGARFALEGPGPNPVEDLTHVTGEWGMRFLLLSLAITPARRWLGWGWVAPLRRTLGLAAFFYALAHLATWAVFDLGLDLAAIAVDVLDRPYVTAGMAAFAILTLLAVTSTRGWMKSLGQRWVVLHRAVYAAAGLAVVHHFWSIKADLRPAIVHGAILFGLLAARVAWRARRTARAR